jgi:teichuronic acid biosynthesis protein TuaF
MELIVKRITARFKRYFLLLVAIPVVLGILGWVLPVGKETSLYTAEATITLGSYGNDDLNDPKK